VPLTVLNIEAGVLFYTVMVMGFKKVADRFFFCHWMHGNSSITAKCIFISQCLLHPLRESRNICFYPEGLPQLLFPSLWKSHDPASPSVPGEFPQNLRGPRCPSTVQLSTRLDWIRCHVEIFSSVQLTVCRGSVEAPKQLANCCIALCRKKDQLWLSN